MGVFYAVAGECPLKASATTSRSDASDWMGWLQDFFHGFRDAAATMHIGWNRQKISQFCFTRPL
jgi:hypothetical protein